MASNNNNSTKEDDAKKYLDSDEDYDSDDSETKDKEIDEIVEDIESDKYGQHDEKTKWTRIKISLREWGESCSCHGIPHMAQATSGLAILIWSIILAFCAVGFVYLFSDTLKQYLKFDKLVKLNLGLESTNFPSITFCNINPYKMSKIQSVPELKALLTVYEASANGTLT